MAGEEDGYSFVENPEFARCLREICDNCEVEYDELYGRAIRVVQWLLSHDPAIRPIVPGSKGLRIIKTARFTKNNVSYPVLRIWYRIVTDHTIELLIVDMVDYIM